MRARSINQIHHVTLEVGNVVIGCCCRAVVINQAVRHTDVIIGEVQRLGRRTVAKQLILIVSPFPGSTEISPSSRGREKKLLVGKKQCVQKLHVRIERKPIE